MIANGNVMLERHSIIRALNEHKNSRVIAICAPAGYGKTVAIEQWLKRDTRARAVFSVDEYDNDIIGFCERFCEALRACQPQNKTFLDIISLPSFHEAPDKFTLRAISALSVRKQTVLVIDDLHFIHNDSVVQLLLVFIKRLPKNFQIVLISCQSLPIGFSELWVKGKVARINADQFLFTDKEIMALYKKRDNPITQEQAKDIFRYTQGWAIGINALFLSNGQMPDDICGHLYDFIKSKIWDKLDEPTRNFMLCTSALSELNPALCEALTGRPDSERILEELMHNGALITQSQRDAYRYHNLFKHFLGRMAKEQGEEFSRSILDIEGNWHLSQGDFYSAIDCFIRCKSHLGISKCFDFLAGPGSSSFALGRLLPILERQEVQDAAKKYPRLLFLLTLRAFAQGNASEMILYIDEFYARHNEILAAYPTSEYTHLFMRIYDFRVSPSQMVGDIGALSVMPNIPISQWSVSLHMPLLHRGIKDYSEISIGSIIENCMQMQSKIGWLLGEEAPMLFKTLIAGLYYEQGELEKSYKYAAQAMSLIKNHFLAESIFCAMSLMICVLDANYNKDTGSPNEADVIIKSIARMIEDTKSYQLSHNYEALVARREFLAGNIKAAKSWLDTNPPQDPTLWGMYSALTSCRAYICIEKYDAAIIMLMKILNIAKIFNRPLDITEAQILLAIAYWKKKGRFQTHALDCLFDAVCTAYPFRHVQIFISDGAEITGMLYKLMKRAEQQKIDSGLFSFIKLLRLKTRDNQNIELPKRSVEPALVFTDKQRAVMHFLCQGKTYNEIADNLGIKRSSLRSHLKLIYSKLDVTNGMDAVAKINKMGLLSE